MRSALIPILLNSVPGWVRNAYPGVTGISLAAHCDTGQYWVRGAGQINADAMFTCVRALGKFVPNAAGVLVPIATGLLPIVDGVGNLIEEARTNVVLWSRDLTNAAWTKSNITAALTQTGADGTANAATSLTATAGNGTCLQAITLASSARFQSAWVKRITGSGTINMTMDNGATWTAITVTAAYTQLTIPTQTLANPTVGFRIVTSGDAIAVDFVGNENSGTSASSPITTTTVAVTRAADSILLAGAALAAALASKSAYTQTKGVNPNQTNSNDNIVFFTGASQALRFGGSTAVGADNSVNSAALATIGGARTFTGRVKAAYGYDASSYTAIANGGAQATSAFAWGSLTGNASLGNRSSDLGRSINGFVERVAFSTIKGQFDGLTA